MILRYQVEILGNSITETITENNYRDESVIP